MAKCVNTKQNGCLYSGEGCFPSWDLGFETVIKWEMATFEGYLQIASVWMKSTVSQEEVDRFILSIQARSDKQVNCFLTRYGKAITNRLHSNSRMPAIYYAMIINCSNEEQIQLIRVLKNHGANVFFKDLLGNSMLHYCCGEGKLPIFEYMLRLGLSPNELNALNQNLLFKLAKGNHIKILQHLICKDLELQVNQIDVTGRTPLFYAAEQGHAIFCQQLVSLGALCTIEDHEGNTPVSYSRKWKHHTLSRYLYNIKRGQEGHQDEGSNVKGDLSILKNTFTFSLKSKEEISFSEPNYVRERKEGDHYDEIETNAQSVEGAWMGRAMRLLRQCMRRKGSHFFMEAVDEEMFGITDYYEIVTRPMYFQKVEAKLEGKEYVSFSAFAEDMQLIFDNCFLYNGLDHPISQIARQIKEYFDSHC